MHSCFTPNEADMARGAYILMEPHKGLADAAVIFNEADSASVVRCAATLAVCGMAVRLICVTDFELFATQGPAYRARILDAELPLVAAVQKDCPWLSQAGAVQAVCPGDAGALASAVKSAISCR